MNDNRCDESSRLFDLLNVSISLFFEQESQVTNNDWVLWCLMYNTYMYLLCCHLQVFSNSSSCVFLEKKWFSLHWSQTPKPILSMCQGDLQWMNRYIVRPSSIFFSFLNVKKDAWWHSVIMWLRVIVGNKFLAKFPWSKEYPPVHSWMNWPWFVRRLGWFFSV